ncbi:DedA family protein [Corynebacterium callunae]|uniref:DedA family protein n=1 Tax=Corynebacterium callunae TaxID=1721 RepID=UPI0039822668
MIMNWIISLMEALGAPGVGFAVFLENVFPPIPSEVVLPLAGFTTTQGDLNVWAALIWSVIGSVTGAYLLYGLGRAVGARRLREIADKMWLVDATDVDKSLLWFEKYGRYSVFFGRLVPGVRSLISIPAGVDKMNPIMFGVLTAVGSTIWNAILIWAGVALGAEWETVSLWFENYSTVIYVVIVLVLLYFLIKLIRRNTAKKSSLD